MLVGPPQRPMLPFPVQQSDDIESIYRYLRGMYEALTVAFSTITVTSSGFLGATGISGTGEVARNLRGSVIIAPGTTSTTVSLLMIEPNASYFVTLGVRPGISCPYVTANYSTPLTTSFLITVSADPTPGFAIVNWHLIR